MKTSSLVVVARSFEMTKTVKDKNLGTRRVSISESERATILPNDTLVLKVLNEDGNVIGGAVYNGRSLQNSLTQREKTVNKRGDTVRFYTLPYTKNKN